MESLAHLIIQELVQGGLQGLACVQAALKFEKSSGTGSRD